jgi:hypothetical protein
MTKAKANYHKILARVRARAMATVKTVALIDGVTVVSHHASFNEANLALCDALEAFYAHDRDGDHTFDIVPLSYVPDIGSTYDRTKTLIIP